MSDYVCDTHIWGTTGTCVRPGCRALRQSGQPGRAHPNVISDERRAAAVALLPTYGNELIARKLHMGKAQVRRIRAEEARER